MSTPDELKGMKVVAEATMIEVAEKLGMDILSVPDEELYGAMEQGVVDAYFNPFMQTAAIGLGEVTKYFIDHPFWYGSLGVIMNLDKWNQIPPDEQALITKVWFETVDKMAPEYEGIITGSRQKLIDMGVEPITFSPDDAKRYLDIPFHRSYDIIQDIPEYGPQLKEMVGNYYQ